MEGRKQSGSSSFTSDLFGSKDSSASSSSGIFGSIFAPPQPKVLGRESVRSETVAKKQDPASQAWNAKPGPPENISQNRGVDNNSMPNRDVSSFYQEEKVQPCHLSSSIYYGGQDVYSRPENSQSTGYTTYNNEGEDDSGCASRGNWWQGSLYY